MGIGTLRRHRLQFNPSIVPAPKPEVTSVADVTPAAPAEMDKPKPKPKSKPEE